jgi:hypothetical protein
MGEVLMGEIRTAPFPIHCARSGGNHLRQAKPTQRADRHAAMKLLGGR